MDLGINGKLALVTGAGQGLGEAICRSLAREGARIIATARTESHLRKICEELGGAAAGHHFFATDIAAEDGPQKLIDFTRRQGLEPDIVINNVGGNLDQKDVFAPIDGWRKVMRLNLETGIELNNHFVPLLQKKQWGRVCHVSSIAAVKDRHSVAYTTAKAAVNAYVRGLACAVAKDNVVVTAVMPGAMLIPGGIWEKRLQETPAAAQDFLQSRLAIKRFASCREISEAVTFLCSEQASFFCGAAVAIDGGTF